jgi:hypothetical protein
VGQVSSLDALRMMAVSHVGDIALYCGTAVCQCKAGGSSNEEAVPSGFTLCPLALILSLSPLLELKEPNIFEVMKGVPIISLIRDS